MDIYFIRHGNPDYYLDLLTSEGRDQAEKTSEFLSKEGIDTFFVSSAGRAKETAKRTLEKVNIKPTICDWMNESYLAPWTIKNFDDGSSQWYFWIDEYIAKFKELDQNPNWTEDPLIKTTKLKDGLEIENKHVDELLLSIGIKHDREKKIYTKISDDVPNKVAVFAHGAMAYAFLSSLLDTTYPHFVNTHKCLEFCGIAKLNITFDKPNSVKEEFFNVLKY